MGLLTSGMCYACGFIYPYLEETCPECGYHRRTKQRLDGKRGLKNDPKLRSQVRENIVREYQRMREKK